MRIPTPSGDELEAWVYQPEGSGPPPAVVIAHGLCAIKACGLAPFAEWNLPADPPKFPLTGRTGTVEHRPA